MPFSTSITSAAGPHDGDGKTVIQQKSGTERLQLVPDQTMNFTYGLLHIDRQHGLKDDDL